MLLDLYRWHRNAETWGPVIPENFTPEKILQRDSNSYLHFSAGPRYCFPLGRTNGPDGKLLMNKLKCWYISILGIKYSWMSMNIILARLLVATVQIHDRT